ncbi:hypothetical protein LQ948_13880 [Jiella sp. MQZ9-1]|uniref:Uncharacterized protein n=1 Tax=Jiella flava TaxID=2816857 RepID=A0A939JX61_9HYPH|nr:hypothetical protein [Jiella flava]MBO0663727.1 hypothetical protein [Jiella flava]MCD2472299.1 hypothetical protein [Jiella flava]
MEINLRDISAESGIKYTIDKIGYIRADIDNLPSFLRRGRFQVIAPKGLSEERLHSFSQGGVTPPGQIIELDKGYMRPVVTLFRELADFIKSNHENMKLYSYDFMYDEEDKDCFDWSYIIINGNIFFFNETKFMDIDTVADFIDGTGYPQCFLMFCTGDDGEKCYSEIQDIIYSSKFIITGIYDGESYMIWSRGAS